LVQAGADLFAAGHLGRTPLHAAAAAPDRDGLAFEAVMHALIGVGVQDVGAGEQEPVMPVGSQSTQDVSSSSSSSSSSLSPMYSLAGSGSGSMSSPATRDPKRKGCKGVVICDLLKLLGARDDYGDTPLQVALSSGNAAVAGIIVGAALSYPS